MGQWANESQIVLDEIAKALKQRHELRIQVRGHSNGGLGNLNIEEELSWSRAANVCEYIVAHGAKASQLELEGLGSTEMIFSAGSTECFKNRRVEFWPLN